LDRRPRLERKEFELSAGIYVRLLRKRCVSIELATLKSIAAEEISPYVV